MTASRAFLYFCLSFVGGIFFDSFFDIPWLVLFSFLILGIMFISVFWGRWNMAIIGFCFLFLVLGIWRYELAQSKIIYPQEKNVIFSGTVAAEPDIRATNIKLTIKNGGGSPSAIFYGKVLVTTDRYPEYQYGDKLKIAGKIEPPKELEDFNYPGYLAKDSVYSVVYYPEIELLERGNYIGATYAFYAGILVFKDGLREVIYKNLSPPQSSILGAMILGDKRQISQEWNEKLGYAGVRHLTAISGMHVAILTVILMNLLLGLGFWRPQAFYLTIVLIVFFIVMTGLQASAVRAGIMACFFLLAQHLGRTNTSSLTVVFAAALMLAHNPLLLKLDIGFQLSFLAMMGIIYFKPVFESLLFRISDFFQLKSVFILTVSAQVFTLPVLIYNFGYFSPLSIITNILIVPLLSFIIGLGLVFVLSGTVWSFFAQAFSFPLWLLLTYLVKVVDWFSGFSFSVYFLEISWVWIVIYYLILAIFLWRFNERQKLKFLN